jgi:hypothetical protein
MNRLGTPHSPSGRWLINFSAFMEPNGSVLCSKNPSVFPYVEPGNFILGLDISFIEIYMVSIKSFPDYKHLLQENYVEYKRMQL